jgi:hypothetical protein
MDDYFGIGSRPEPMSAPFQRRAKCPVVVYLAVERDPAGAILIRQGLPPRLAIDDREPPVTETHDSIGKDAAAIRTAMAEGVSHVVERRPKFWIQVALHGNQAGDSAHLHTSGVLTFSGHFSVGQDGGHSYLGHAYRQAEF